MAMTAMVKDELSRGECSKTSERKAEVTALLRFSGGLHIVGGRVVIEAELDTGSVARRLRRDISEVYGYTSGVSVLAGGNIRRGVRYLVRIAKHGEGLARQTGLVDQRGRPVRGLPPAVVSGSIGDAEAAWRGAFLAHGSLTEPGRSSSLEELGQRADPPMTKDAVAGRIRRLLAMADKRAKDLGIPDTESVVTEDMLAQ
jgi:DNA-binding protein WhiA